MQIKQSALDSSRPLYSRSYPYFFLGLTLTLLSPILASTAAGQGLEAKILGQWKGDLELTEKFYEKIGMDVPAFVKSRAGTTSIRFDKDNKLLVKVEENGQVEFEAKGKWKILKTDESKKELVVQFSPIGKDDPPEDDITIRMISFGMKNGMAVGPGGEQWIVFVKSMKMSK